MWREFCAQFCSKSFYHTLDHEQPYKKGSTSSIWKKTKKILISLSLSLVNINCIKISGTSLTGNRMQRICKLLTKLKIIHFYKQTPFLPLRNKVFPLCLNFFCCERHLLFFQGVQGADTKSTPC